MSFFVHSRWDEWTSWAPCSVSCGGSAKFCRQRWKTPAPAKISTRGGGVTFRRRRPSLLGRPHVCSRVTGHLEDPARIGIMANDCGREQQPELPEFPELALKFYSP